MTIRQRETSKKNDTNKENTNEKPSGPRQPFRGRFNPQFQRRPERTGDGTLLDHQAWTKIVMAGMVGIIVYVTINQKTDHHETPLAKQSEFLNGKRSQNSLCPPSYKAEIKKLGNESKFVFLIFKIKL